VPDSSLAEGCLVLERRSGRSRAIRSVISRPCRSAFYHAHHLLSRLTEDLLEALDNNLSGCGLDVTDPEPLTQDHPLYTHPDVIVTPHISGNAEREGERAIDLLLENAQRFRDGKELFNVVDIEKGY
jgi:hypothetical protein